MSLFVASLYLLCLAFLFGAGLYVYSRDPLSRLNSSFAVLAFSLLGWVGTLFVFNAQTAGPTLLWLGRANFATAAIAPPATFLFVQALARKPVNWLGWLWLETGLFAVVSLLTGWVGQAEVVPFGLRSNSVRKCVKKPSHIPISGCSIATRTKSYRPLLIPNTCRA